jgi:hypothetical protein
VHIIEETISRAKFIIVHHMKNVLSTATAIILLLSGLNVNFVHHSGESDTLADVLFACQPGDGTFYSEAETAVGHGAVSSQVQIPTVIFRV